MMQSPDLSFSLAGRKALVTGGSRGIGAAIARLFAEAGADVAVCHFGDKGGADDLSKNFRELDRVLHAHECDVAQETEVDALAEWTTETLGKIDILVNCAGIGGQDKPFREVSVAEWDRMIGINLRGVFLVTRAFFPGMIDRGYGRIVNVASQLAYKGAPGLAAYVAAKSGVVGLTRALSYEGAPHNVMVNGIAPGPVETPLLLSHSDAWLKMKKGQLPVGRFGRTYEIAPTALLLASETGGAFYCGQTLSPNGGDVML
ncbi:SDR family NAD(P)-dependent oxidoreductase [Celeribacter indicus]|uniref:Short-chain dehydrogenase/reductase SDR n=1 Tax=Celeribacter indicus TaxID=1208324 RepID=A0A0B5E0J0_9RHOB|nr:3-oxoacyl-ACP reductase family protein [Celeribacter indicus]AJE48769.1 short-chain dehydrogenase/reductase SDR [Celeribacter indicus]SDX11025.1 3-oxoacyl-[acyl-carrier protein] reductase [Celeribacter indicus]